MRYFNEISAKFSAIFFCFFLFCGIAQSGNIQFVENQGQIRLPEGMKTSDVPFSADAKGLKLFFNRSGVNYVFSKVLRSASLDTIPEKKHNSENDTLVEYRMDMHLLGTNSAAVIASLGDASEYLRNYYLSHCPDGIFGVRSFDAVFYENIYPNIDMMFYSGAGGGLKYDFIVREGGNPADIQFEYIGANSVQLTLEGKIRVENPLGIIEEQRPLSFLTEKDKSHATTLLSRTKSKNSTADAIASGFVLKNGIISFATGNYNRSQTLVIDPDISWATYHGGNQDDNPTDMELDSKGNAWICGATVSTDLPTTPGAFQTSRIGTVLDIFITKFSKNGSRLYSTYYGGDSNDICKKISVDHADNAVIVGETFSPNFPVVNGVQSVFNGGATAAGASDVVILKFDSTGRRLWATFWGSSVSLEVSSGACIDKFNNIIVLGYVGAAGLPTTQNAFQKNFAGGNTDCFMTKFSPAGDTLWSSYIGGNADEVFAGSQSYSGWKPVLDTANNIYLTGYTTSTNFPTSSSAVQKINRGMQDAFIMKFNQNCAMIWSTYFGGNKDDYGVDIALDRYTNVFFTGGTRSSNFPVTYKAIKKTFGKLNPTSFDADAFMMKLNGATGDTLWSTYYGGNMNDMIFATSYVGRRIATDTVGNCFLAGATYSTVLPVKLSRTQTSFNGSGADIYIVKFKFDGDTLWGTYLGGHGSEHLGGISVDAFGNLLVIGETNSTDLPLFPINGPYLQSTNHGGSDLVIAKYNNYPGDCLWQTYYGGAGDEYPLAMAIDKNLDLMILGQSTGAGLTVVNAAQPNLAGRPDAFLLKLGDCAQPPKPTISITTGSLAFCEGGSVNLNLEPRPLNKVYSTLQWSTGDVFQSITATSSGTYTVFVTNEFGCIGSTSISVTVYPKPRPTITSANGTILCVGGKTILSAPDGFSSYEWNTGKNVQTIEVSQAGNYIVTVTNKQNCIGSSSITIEVHQPPTPTITSATPTTFCEGGSVVLSVPTKFLTYQWSSDETTPTITVKKSGTFRLNVIDSAGCVGQSQNLITVVVKPLPSAVLQGPNSVCVNSDNIYSVSGNPDDVNWGVSGVGFKTFSTIHKPDTVSINWGNAGTAHIHLTVTKNGCTKDSTFDVIVSDKLSPTIGALESTGSTVQICEGEIAHLIAPDGYDSYLWSNGQFGQNLPVNTSGIYSVSVIKKSCSGTSNSITVVVNPKPIPLIQSLSSVCLGVDAVYAVQNASGHSYKWAASSNGTITTGDNIPQIKVNWQSGTSGKVTVTETIDASGCKDSTDFTVQIQNLPKPSLQAVGGTCEGDSVEISAGNFTSYLWSTGETTATIIVKSSKKISVIASNSAGCTSASNLLDIKFLPKPHPIISASGISKICAGDSVQLDAGTGFSSYKWSNGVLSQKNWVKNAGNYWVTVKNSDGCEGNSDTTAVIVNPIPTAPTLTQTNDSLFSTPASSYQWFLNGSAISGATSRSIFIAQSGLYSVTIIDANGCAAVSAQFPTGNASATVAFRGNSFSANAGEKISVPLELRSSKNLALSGAKNFTTKIRFNKTLLLPTGSTPMGIIDGNDRVITISGSRADTVGTLTTLEFIAALGTTTSTPLIIETFTWTDGQAKTDSVNGTFTLNGVCQAGGTRLAYNVGTTSLTHRPNPFGEGAEIEYEITEPGQTRLFIVDALGKTATVVAEGEIPVGRYIINFDGTTLPTGTYFCILQTPTQKLVRRMEVAR